MKQTRERKRTSSAGVHPALDARAWHFKKKGSLCLPLSFSKGAARSLQGLAGTFNEGPASTALPARAQQPLVFFWSRQVEKTNKRMSPAASAKTTEPCRRAAHPTQVSSSKARGGKDFSCTGKILPCLSPAELCREPQHSTHLFLHSQANDATQKKEETQNQRKKKKGHNENCLLTTTLFKGPSCLRRVTYAQFSLLSLLPWAMVI